MLPSGHAHGGPRSAATPDHHHAKPPSICECGCVLGFHSVRRAEGEWMHEAGERGALVSSKSPPARNMQLSTAPCRPSAPCVLFDWMVDV